MLGCKNKKKEDFFESYNVGIQKRFLCHIIFFNPNNKYCAYTFHVSMFGCVYVCMLTYTHPPYRSNPNQKPSPSSYIYKKKIEENVTQNKKKIISTTHNTCKDRAGAKKIVIIIIISQPLDVYFV